MAHILHELLSNMVLHNYVYSLIISNILTVVYPIIIKLSILKSACISILKVKSYFLIAITIKLIVFVL